MVSIIPITLVGKNLGERHRYLNNLVSETFKQGLPIQPILDLPEKSPVDRLFKIDLASKHRNVDYILENLKEEDMLYVSRSLKCLWLLDAQYSDIINPNYLESTIFPEMTLPAINKFIHWITLHLKDAERCQGFYDYYQEKKFNIAIKFLEQCSNEFIVSNVINIIHKITPKCLTRLVKKCSEVAKIYFDKLKESTNQELISAYLSNEKKYYDSVKYVLKSNSDIFFNIIERFSTKQISSASTKYVMKNYKNRFMNKSELYTVYFLDKKTLARYLNDEEIKDIILKLARANYLKNWFSYQSVEPLIKKLNVNERPSFKRLIFVDKKYGIEEQEWQYLVPSSPTLHRSKDPSIFVDIEHDPPIEDVIKKRSITKRCIKHRKGNFERSTLDKLFDQYRVASYNQTLFELRKRIVTESSHQNRQNMLLVLVSKTGGEENHLVSLLKLLCEHHRNEPASLRACVVRSLVCRAKVWRLPEPTWRLLLDFGSDLGMHGDEAVADCREGFHARVIRDLLLGNELLPKIRDTFLDNFSTLAEYSLSGIERKKILSGLTKILLNVNVNSDSNRAYDCIYSLMLVFDTYHVSRADYNTLIPYVKKCTANFLPNTEYLLIRLFNVKVGRKELFQENFKFIQTEASYLNALRHDSSILSGEDFDKLIEEGNLDHNRFISKLSIYFGERQGLAQHYLSILEHRSESKPQVKLARPLAILIGSNFEEKLKELDAKSNENIYKYLVAALRANGHLTRPSINLDKIGWQAIGSKAVTNKVIICKGVNILEYLNKALCWQRTAKLVLHLARRCDKELHYYLGAVTKLRPCYAIKFGLTLLKQNTQDMRIWNVIKPVILGLDFSLRKHRHLLKEMKNLSPISLDFKADYYKTMYEVYRRFLNEKVMSIIYNIETILPEVDELVIINIIETFMQDTFTVENVSTKNDSYFVQCNCLVIRIIAKFLLLNMSLESQEKRLSKIGEPFFQRIQYLWKTMTEKSSLCIYIHDFLLSLKCTQVFLNPDFISAMPVLKRVVNWMKDFLNVEEYFDRYVHIHLTMIYFKCIRQCLKQRPELFTSISENENECTEVLGTIFGKYIVHEIDQLVKLYFDSIIDLYQSDLCSYILKYFKSSINRCKFVKFIIKGIIEESKNNQTQLISEYLYQQKRLICVETINEEVMMMLKDANNKQIDFFINSNIYT